MWFIWLSVALLQQCMYVCMYVCLYACMWFIWLSVALLHQCMYVVHLAKCCIIVTVYVCGSSG